ncbi:hypothetical protein BJ165DRAFT_1401166 [Panaeolus papilionaceus]|nr:hypothetical protein BJ165DRAFT_1401166 [Panaeolus papilionaceus]
MHLLTIAALISCTFFANTHALPTPGSALNGRDVVAMNLREDSSVASSIPLAWKREGAISRAWERAEVVPVPPDWRRSADASPNLARDAEAAPPDWKREVSTNEAVPVSPDWKREASEVDQREYPKSPSWRRDTGNAEDYPPSPSWRRASSP